MVNISLFEHIQSLLFSDVRVDVSQESIVGFEVELLILWGVAKAVENFGQVQVVRFDVEP